MHINLSTILLKFVKVNKLSKNAKKLLTNGYGSDILFIVARSSIFGIIRGEGPPVPIPNTEVKLAIAENT